MKKLLIILALALPMLAGAQTTPKFGYVNTQELFALMPELKAAQARMDSLNKQYEDMLVGMQEEYKKKAAEYEQKSATMTDAMKQIQEEDLYTMQQRIQTTYQTAQQDIQAKQTEFLKPVQERMVKAIEAVGAREGFTYIFDSAATIYAAPSATNVIESVKKELGIK
jgi:outer membrane protein